MKHQHHFSPIKLQYLDFSLFNPPSIKLDFDAELKKLSKYNFSYLNSDDMILDDEYDIQDKESIPSFIHEISPFDDLLLKIKTSEEETIINNIDKKIIDKTEKENIQQEIKENILLKRPFKEKKKLGRKIKSDKILGEHNKYSDDNILRKLKNAVLNYVFEHINSKITEKYYDEYQNSIKEKLLFRLQQKPLERGKADYNKELLNRTLSSIFSEKISSKYSRHSPNHNKEIIEELINEENEDKRLFFNNIFNLTFRDCLNHFRDTNNIKELEGMEKFGQYCKKNDLEKCEKYKKLMEYFLINYEKVIMDKKVRQYKKKDKNVK